jgi:hypothetical protein
VRSRLGVRLEKSHPGSMTSKLARGRRAHNSRADYHHVLLVLPGATLDMCTPLLQTGVARESRQMGAQRRQPDAPAPDNVVVVLNTNISALKLA